MLSGAVMVLPLAGVDLAAERARLEEEKALVQREVARLEALIADPAFLARAPELVKEKEAQRLSGHRERLERLAQTRQLLG